MKRLHLVPCLLYFGLGVNLDHRRDADAVWGGGMWQYALRALNAPYKCRFNWLWRCLYIKGLPSPGHHVVLPVQTSVFAGAARQLHTDARLNDAL